MHIFNLIVGCWMSSDKYFMHVQDENKFTINALGQSCNKSHPNVGNLDCNKENEVILGTAIVSLNGLLLNVFTMQRTGHTLFMRHQIYNVPDLTRSFCLLVHPNCTNQLYSKCYTVSPKKT